MRSAIREYIEPTDEEKKNLWEDATFIFDTNVFLNLYRYSSQAREQLLVAFEELKDQIWMPYQVAYEFCKDRNEVIHEANKRYADLSKASDAFINECLRTLRLEKEDKDIDALSKYLEQWLKKRKEKDLNITSTSDIVFDTILSLFDGKVGSPFSAEDKSNLEAEGKRRYSTKTPPGYKDAAKEENMYGDFFAWKEILKYAKDNKKNIIFVTSDQKEDWWNLSHGKTIGPRIELRKEFYDFTGQKFHMYNMNQFLLIFGSVTGSKIDESTMDEVNVVADLTPKTVPFIDSTSAESIIELPKLSIKHSRDAQLDISKIESEISYLTQKNKKRLQQINKLQQKNELTAEEITALRKNLINFSRDQYRIEQKAKQINTYYSKKLF